MATIYSSCKKDNANSPSRTELLTSAPWILTALTFHGDYDGDGVIDPIDKDLFAEWDACLKDDITIYNADGSGIYDHGPDNCSGLPQTSTFSWSFYNPYTQSIDENVIKYKDFGFDALSIVELSSTTLKLKDYINSSYFHLYTYSH